MHAGMIIIRACLLFDKRMFRGSVCERRVLGGEESARFISGKTGIVSRTETSESTARDWLYLCIRFPLTNREETVNLCLHDVCNAVNCFHAISVERDSSSRVPSPGYRPDFRRAVYSWRHDFLNEREAPACKNNATLRRQRRERAPRLTIATLARARAPRYFSVKRGASRPRMNLKYESRRKRGIPRVANSVAAINAKRVSDDTLASPLPPPLSGPYVRYDTSVADASTLTPSMKQCSSGEF